MNRIIEIANKNVQYYIALYLRAQYVPQGSDDHASIMTRTMRLVSRELRLCLQHDKVQLRLRDETLALIFFGQFRFLAVVAYFAYGTVAFSSLGFIGESEYVEKLKLIWDNPYNIDETKTLSTGYNDAVTILAQCMGSAVIRRLVLMFELASMRLTSSHDASLYQDDNRANSELNPTFYELREDGHSAEVRGEMPSALAARGLGRANVNFPKRG